MPGKGSKPPRRQPKQARALQTIEVVLEAAARVLREHGYARATTNRIAEQAGVKSIDLADDRLQIRFHDRPSIEPERVLELVSSENGSLTPSGMLSLPAPARGEDRIQAVTGVLRRILGQSAA